MERDDAGRLVAAKTTEPAASGALMAEAELLRRAQMPGVVELIAAHPAPVPTLLTRWVGTRSLADLPLPLPPEQAAALCLAVASTIESLHRTGIAHGAVEPANVLLDAGGRPVLCGFGSAGLIGAPVRRPVPDQLGRSSAAPGVDGVDGVDATIRSAVDVAGLGRLLAHLVASPDGPEPLLGRVSSAGRRSGRHGAARRRALLAVAGQASVEDPTCRPSVAAFIHSMRRAVPDARLGELPAASSVPVSGRAGATAPRHLIGDPSAPDQTDESGPHRTWADLVDDLAANHHHDLDTADPTARIGARQMPLPDRAAVDDGAVAQLFADLDQRSPSRASVGPGGARTLRTWLPATAAVVAIGATTYFGLSAWWSTSSAGTGLATADSRSADSDAARGDDRDAPPASDLSAAATAPGADAGTVADESDGSGAPPSSPSGTEATSAPVVEHDGRRYAVGQPGDVVAPGPWLCDGRELLLLLRPATGSVHLFLEWPTPGGTLDAPVVATVAGGSSLSTAPESSASTCPQVVVGRRDGTSIRLSPEDLR